jgi:hypothetical protein
VNRNTSLTFSAAKGDPINVADAAAGTSTVEQLTVTTTHGKIKLSTTSGLKVLAGANNSASFTVSGTLARLNAALNGLVFTPTSGYIGAASFTLLLKDVGNQLTGAATVNVTVNGPPTFSVPGSSTLSENSSLVFSSAIGNAISLIDSGASGGSNMQLVLSAGHGTLSLATTANVSFVSGGNNKASMTIVGSLSSLMTALDGLTYTPTAKYVGAASIKLTAKDLIDNLSSSATSIALKVTKVAPAAVGGQSSAPALHQASPTPPPAVTPGISEGSSLIAGGDIAIDESNYWAGLAAAIEMMNRP